MNYSKNQVELSVIACTRNRARQLATLFQCLGSQKNIKELNWEIIIVDNNSNDNTKEVAYAFCEGTNLKVNYLFEERVGLSYARNAGILASKGSNLLFVDDDVLIPDDFFCNVLFGVQEFSEYHIFGFRVLPEWPEMRSGNSVFKPPFWLTFKKPLNLPINIIQSFLPIHDLGKEVLQYPNRIAKNPIGACFLVKKEVFEKVGPFREDLGAGSTSGLCEDTEFFWYSILNGFKILYWPYAFLYHPVENKRLSVKYLHRWYFNLGKSLYLIKNTGRTKNMFAGSKQIFNKSSLLWLKLFALVILLPFSFLLLFIKRPFYFSTLFFKIAGEIDQAFKSNNKV